MAATKKLLGADHYLGTRQALAMARLHACMALPDGEDKQRLRAAVEDAMGALGEAGRVRQALAELVRLKDGPRGGEYRASKDAAWQRARELLAEERP